MKKLKIVIILLAIGPAGRAQSRWQVAQSAADWVAIAGNITEENYLGRRAFHLSRGFAYLPASNLADGTIEVDIAPGLPGMDGIAFHADSAHNYEVTYIRNIKSGGYDALQYCPEYKGELSWQLYPEYQARAIFSQNAWIHLKIIIKDRTERVYVMNADTAALLVDSLRIPNKSGHVGFFSLTGGYFSNYRYTMDVAQAKDIGKPIGPVLVRNDQAIQHWQISESKVYTPQLMASFSAQFANLLTWRSVSTEPDGLLNINRYAKKSVGLMNSRNSEDVVWLRYDWTEPTDGTKKLSFEYANRCAIFINSTKVFDGDNSFFLKGPLFRGDIDKRLSANNRLLAKELCGALEDSFFAGWKYRSTVGCQSFRRPNSGVTPG